MMRVGLSALLFLGLLGQCRGVAVECRSPTDCAADEACFEGHCFFSCRSDVDCPSGEACGSGVCRPGLRECQSADCAPAPGDGPGPTDGADPTPVGDDTVVLPDIDLPTNCTIDSDCGEPVHGPFGACDYTDTCDEGAMRYRALLTPRCDLQNACYIETTEESEPCSRGTTGQSCAANVEGAWVCADFADGCDESGTEQRIVTIYQCTQGVCAGSTGPETRPCSRDTDDTDCGTTAWTGWSACDYSGTCDEAAQQSRSRTVKTCGAGVCNSTPATENSPCTRDTDTVDCGTGSWSGWSGCGYSDACDNNAPNETRSRTVRTCVGGACNQSTETQSSGCSRNTNGDTCQTVNVCGTSVGCKSCNGGTCSSTNTPDFDSSCAPSCGVWAFYCSAGASCCEGVDTCGGRGTHSPEQGCTGSGGGDNKCCRGDCN